MLIDKIHLKILKQKFDNNINIVLKFEKEGVKLLIGMGIEDESDNNKTKKFEFERIFSWS